MEMDHSDAGKGIDAGNLLRKYADGTATPRERALYEQWYHSLHLKDPAQLTEEELAAAERSLLTSLQARISAAPARVRRTGFLWRGAAAAAILLLLVGGYILFSPFPSKNSTKAVPTAVADIAPGKNTATLRLANGDVIQLSESKTGVVIDGTALSYNDGSALNAPAVASGESRLLIASTPRGGTYQFILNDGTKVWLNADSKLEFAAVFTGKERRVKLSGEAYFDVTQDAARPFIVESNGQSVKVLGTEFNINSYTDEPSIKTTVLAGSVQVMQGNSSKTALLQAGEQSSCTSGSLRSGIAAQADVDQAVAWKHGDFIFDSDIQTIMKQIARWYDVDVSYRGPVPTEEFGGKVSRSKSIRQVLKILESTNSIHFELKERRITVMQ